MVEALTEDDSIHNYAQRKRELRAQVIGAGATVMDIALADKIATLQHARITVTRVRRRKLAHYDATLQLAVAAGADEALCQRVAELLEPNPDPGANGSRRYGRRWWRPGDLRPPLCARPAQPSGLDRPWTRGMPCGRVGSCVQRRVQSARNSRWLSQSRAES
jgi:hypothetical protein